MSFDRVAGVALIDPLVEDRIHLAKPFLLGAAEGLCSTERIDSFWADAMGEANRGIDKVLVTRWALVQALWSFGAQRKRSGDAVRSAQ